MTERVLGPTGSPRRRRTLFLPVLAALVVGLAIGVPAAVGSHPEASLSGSNFEIDVNANLKRDDASPSIDWASVNETRDSDEPTGQSDDSYGGGSKEDDACPNTGTGSIPNNKSDLLTFGAYVESEVGGPGFLHLFWHRVEEPSGTTLMDFELNKSGTDCGNGVNRVRTAGDLLIEYRIEQGGATAALKVREWSGTAWGAATDLTATSQAVGTINSTDIPGAESDGLGATEARTFGELSLDLDFIFDEGTCDSFGSAFLKSRSSDAFTSQLKDFIKPIPVNIANCASVIIHKQTVPDGDQQEFGFTKSYTTDPASGTTFSLKDGETQDDSDIALFGNNLTVSEDAVTADGYSFVSVSCAAGNVVPDSVVGQVVTFDLDSASDVLECTFNNKKEEGSIKVLKQSIKGDAPLQGAVFSVEGNGTITTGADGYACIDGLAFGDYDVTEVTAPGGYAIDNPAAVVATVSENSECPAGATSSTLVFDDTPLTDIDVSANSQDDGPGGTNTIITCVDEDDEDLTGSPTQNVHDPSISVDNLHPGTYTCTLVIDP